MIILSAVAKTTTKVSSR